MISGFSVHSKNRTFQRIPDRNTLLVYWFLCSTKKRKGARSVQRALGFASPSTAVFHLTRLVEMGLLEKQREGHYSVVHRRKFGLMTQFFNLGSWWIPKPLVYGLITTIAILVTTILLYPLIAWIVIPAIIPATLAAIIQLYEALILFKRRPSFSNS